MSKPREWHRFDGSPVPVTCRRKVRASLIYLTRICQGKDDTMPPRLSRIFIASALTSVLAIFGWMSWGRTASSTDGERKLAGCPKSPNCVSSMESQGNHWIAPLNLTTSVETAFQCLRQIILQMKRATIIVAEKGYIRAEFKSILGFVDDVEFEVDDGKRIVNMRSASRVGYWDIGVNRRRLEAIRTAFNERCK